MRLMYGDQEVIGNQEYVAGPGVNIEGNTISASIPVEEASPTDEQKDGVLYLVDEPEWMPLSVSIQEYDTEDGWHVRKRSDGYVELLKTFEYTAVSWAGTVASLYAHNFAAVPLPFKLETVYTNEFHFVEPIGSGIWATSAVRTGYVYGETTASYLLLSLLNPGANKSFVIALRVTGRWK